MCYIESEISFALLSVPSLSRFLGEGKGEGSTGAAPPSPQSSPSKEGEEANLR